MTRSRLALVLLLTLTGCSSMSWSARKDYKYDKPALAVITFENRSNAPLNWKLGESVAELLSNSLYRTGQFRVLEREHLDAVMKEQQLQSTRHTYAKSTLKRTSADKIPAAEQRLQSTTHTYAQRTLKKTRADKIPAAEQRPQSSGCRAAAAEQRLQSSSCRAAAAEHNTHIRPEHLEENKRR